MTQKNTYSLLHIHSTYSTLDGLGSPEANVRRAKELGLHALSLSDHGVITGLVEHFKACKKHKMKFIAGCELYITHQCAAIKDQNNRNRTHMVVWSKNKQGWYDLINLISQTNHPDYYYYKPRIYPWNHTDENGKFWPGLEHYCKGNIAGCSGHHGSLLSDNLFCDLYGDPEKRNADLKRAYAQYKGVKTEYYKQFLKPNWFESTCELALKLEKVFGKGNFYIELQNELNPEDQLALWIHPLMVDCLRQVAKAAGIPAFASSDPHYPTKEEADLQRCMVMVNMKETENSINQKLTSSDEMDLMVFFGSSEFYIHSYDEMAKKFTEEELEMSNKIADDVEEYNITENPYIPKFSVPEFPRDNKFLKSYKNDSDKYLMHLCIEGANKIRPWNSSSYTKDDYWKRLQEETSVIFEFGLSDYFLVVWDICMAADYRPADHSFNWDENLKSKGNIDPVPRGIGRGSAANCLISYLINITGIDPVKHELLFSRFFNAGRCSKDHISLPDIDLDFDVLGRNYILDYIRYKYGNENVGQILSCMTTKGRAALKDMFRVKNVEGGFDLINKVCETVAAEHVIADEIQQMKNEGEEDYNILRWTLDNVEEFQEYYKDPKLKPIIDQAIQLEGVKRGTGKHPSGIAISNVPLETRYPMVYDARSKQRIIGLDLKSVEPLGLAKFDILGVAVLSKLDMVQKMVNSRNG